MTASITRRKLSSTLAGIALCLAVAAPAPPATAMGTGGTDTVRSLAAVLRRSDPSRIDDVVSAYTPARDMETRASLMQVMGQSGNAKALPILRAGLQDQDPELKRAAILALPAIYRAPVMLRDIQGMSTEEASALLRVKDQTLKSRLHRGRLILRKQLADFADGLTLHGPIYGT